ncbi:MAG: HD domain-containing protein [Patescibacteria group bacterium]
MKYDYNKIRNEVREIVKEACYSEKNAFDCTVFDNHILPVVEHSLKLGRKFKVNSNGQLKVDFEVLELSALLHDYAGVNDFNLYKDHHLHSAKMADKILSRLNYPVSKINHIKECITSHRGSVKISKNTVEAKILASADAMAHFTELADMFFLAFNVHGYKTQEGSKWLKKKLMRSWKKITPEGKKMVENDYKIAINILNKAIK